MTDADRIAALEKALADEKESTDKIHAALPALFAFRDNFELWAKETGVWDHLVQDVLSRVPKTSAPPATVPASSVTPIATHDGIPGLTQGQIDAVNRAMDNGVAAGVADSGARDAIASQLAAGVYKYGNTAVIDAVKLWYYNGASQADQSALFPYLAIIDQRDANNQPLPIGDGRWKDVVDSPITNSPAVSSSLVEGLRALGIYCTNGRVGLGGEPVQDTDALLTIYGGQILGKNVGNWQNPGAVIENILDIANSDGGIRFLQYLRYFLGQAIRSAPTRPVDPKDLSKGMESNPASVFAIFDSHGDTCISDSRVPYGQVFYIVKSPSNGTVTIASYHPEIKLQLRDSSTYGAADIPVQP